MNITFNRLYTQNRNIKHCSYPIRFHNNRSYIEPNNTENQRAYRRYNITASKNPSDDDSPFILIDKGDYSIKSCFSCSILHISQIFILHVLQNEEKELKCFLHKESYLFKSVIKCPFEGLCTFIIQYKQINLLHFVQYIHSLSSLLLHSHFSFFNECFLYDLIY